MRRLGLLLPLAALACGGPTPPPTADQSAAGDEETWFQPSSQLLDWRHRRATEPRFWFPEIMSGGAGWLDYDRDGDPDLYLVQGGDLKGGSGPSNRLLRNDGDRFVDVTEASGAGENGYGMGVIVADLDGDGFPDLYVTNVGSDRMFRNRGDGTFEALRDTTTADGWGTSGAAVDVDSDGDLDLYVVRYVQWSPAVELECFGVGGARDYCHPSRYQAPASDVLLRNDGGFTFTDVSADVGLRTTFGNGLGVVVGDFTGNGARDVYVANDGMPNQLWEWRRGRLDDVAIERGCAVSGMGIAEAGMGVTAGDVSGDGLPDLFLTHLARETNTLYRLTEDACRDETGRRGLGAPSLAFTGFGTGFADFDHDGALDAWVANGRVGRESLADDRPFAEPDHVYRGSDEGIFSLLPGDESGVGATPDTSRAAAFADSDLDGDVDVLTVENDGPARLYQNRANAGSWLRARIELPSGAPALGAKLVLRAGGRDRTRWLERAYGYLSSHEPVVHFGLGETRSVERLHVTHGERTVVFASLPADREIVVRLLD